MYRRLESLLKLRNMKDQVDSYSVKQLNFVCNLAYFIYHLIWVVERGFSFLLGWDASEWKQYNWSLMNAWSPKLNSMSCRCLLAEFFILSYALCMLLLSSFRTKFFSLIKLSISSTLEQSFTQWRSSGGSLPYTTLKGVFPVKLWYEVLYQ